MATNTNPNLAATWYQLDAFLRKVEDEIYRAVRYQVPFSVIACTLAFVNAATGPQIDGFVLDGLRQIDFASKVSNGRYAFALPFTGSQGAEVVANRLRMQVIDFQPLVGSATAPEEGTKATMLLNSADRNGRERHSGLQRAG